MNSNGIGIDFEASLGAVTRIVSEEYEKDGNLVRNVTLERFYDTAAEDLWDAVTNPERLGRFFGSVSGDLKLGGRYFIEGNADGTITECVPPQFFAATWEFPEEVSWITVRVTPEGDARSRLTVTHICPLGEHWEQYGPGAGGVGWDLVLLGLEFHFSDATFDLADGEALLTSDEAKVFMVGASEDWGRAAMAAGESPAQAEAAAQRTSAFFRGEAIQED